MTVEGTGISATAAGIAGAIKRAARATGASFDYLLAAAKVESNLNPEVKARTSSATGLFQFIEQTWLATLKAAGPSLGYGRYSEAIVQTPSGGYTVHDAGMRQAVLKLRRDPIANAAMAGAFTQQNGAELRAQLGRPATHGELYIAHFLGANGAAKLIGLAATTPSVRADNLFPTAAAANRSVFYDRQGQARPVGEVYAALVSRFETARTATRALAAAAPIAPRPGAAKVPDTAGMADALAMISAVPVARSADSAPAFHGLFKTGGSRQAISPVVAAFWGGSGVEPRSPLRPPPVGPAAPHEPRDLRGLYQNDRGDIRGLFDGTS